MDEFERAWKYQKKFERACYELAKKVGRATIFDFEDELDGELSFERAFFAMKEAQRVFWNQILFFRNEFFKEWNGAIPEEKVELACGIVEFLNEMVSVMEAISQTYEWILQTHDDAHRKIFEEEFDAVGKCVEEINNTLQSNSYLKVLVTISNLPILHNYRGLLKGDRRTAPPWWLDGETIESAVKRLGDYHDAKSPPSVN